MEKNNITNGSKVENQASDEYPTEINPVSEGQNSDKHPNYEQIEKKLNSKILEVTMQIKEQYPELSKYLEEMPETIPSEENPEITLNQLKLYYESLKSIVDKYKVDHPKTEE
jgi:hypothetical protein